MWQQHCQTYMAIASVLTMQVATAAAAAARDMQLQQLLDL
jgi:hypothetical protein